MSLGSYAGFFPGVGPVGGTVREERTYVGLEPGG